MHDAVKECGCQCSGGCGTSSATQQDDCHSAETIERPVVLITGGAVRIGAAICRTFFLAGYDLVIHYNRSEEAAVALRDECRAMGAVAVALRAELANPEEITKLISDAWSVAGRLDTVVNNASVFSRQSLLDAGAEEFEHQWRINTLAPILITREYARILNEKGSNDDSFPQGSVVNMLDRRIATNEAGSLAYLCSKKALAAFSESAALELAPYIRVNAVAPGAILPPPDSSMSESAGSSPLNRRCTPDDVAQAVYFLAQAEGITGQTIYVDSGQHLSALKA